MYYRTVPASSTLAEIESDIGDEELGASLFVECKAAPVRIGDADAKEMNLLKFQELEPGDVPASASLTHTRRDGEEPKWQGQMFVSGKLKLVYVYR
jgi:hypothetical protein